MSLLKDIRAMQICIPSTSVDTGAKKRRRNVKGEVNQGVGAENQPGICNPAGIGDAAGSQAERAFPHNGTFCQLRAGGREAAKSSFSSQSTQKNRFSEPSHARNCHSVPQESSTDARAAVVRHLELDFACTEPGWATEPRIAARLIERVRTDVPDKALPQLASDYVAEIAAGHRPARALLNAIRRSQRYGIS